MDYGFLPKTQPDLHLTEHVSLYRRLGGNPARIMVFFDITKLTSGPDLRYEYSYTSILRLGLAAGDTPDAPCYHLGTRGPSSALRTRSMLLRSRTARGPSPPSSGYCPGTMQEDIENHPEDSCSARGYLPRLRPDALKNPIQIRLSLFKESGDDTTFLVCVTRSPKITERISPTRDIHQDMLLSIDLTPL
ncbi:pentatricopeptide repeat-containing protein [Dorcoceras hygrometricum]|uniref:Pentatricopeptide repeat-containing protein n=1 Tax=Dorcoceras hygrometricum TaxID=472368 RepID=A0A2Z7B0C4_9LAMI|nr:pentatricopeptide repeat-containing protein [Dorcoceras hygrometricum]